MNLYGNGLVSSGGETLLEDGLGAARQTTNSSQSVGWSSAFTAFGQPIAVGGSTTNHYGWGAGSGYRSDSFGPTHAAPLIKVGARYYDPEFGCFLTRDTVLTEKPYIYCNGDPVDCTDPTGRDGVPLWVWGFGIVIVLGAIAYGAWKLGKGIKNLRGGPIDKYGSPDYGQ